jgi:D-alanine-D-alanine ligase
MTGILKSKKVAVLLGGPGSEREVSLRSGAAVARALQALGAIVEEVDVRDPGFSLFPGVDLAYNMIHGTFGEDGQIQKILE